MNLSINVKRITKCAIFGAVGFGIGWLIAGVFQESIGTSNDYFSASVLIMPIWGGLGAASLGLALQVGTNRTAVLAVIGGAAPIVGIMMVALLVTITSDTSIWLIYIVALITMSIVAGVLFGLTS